MKWQCGNGAAGKQSAGHTNSIKGDYENMNKTMTKTQAVTTMNRAWKMFRKTALMNREEALETMWQLIFTSEAFIEEISKNEKITRDSDRENIIKRFFGGKPLTRKVALNAIATAIYFAQCGHEKYQLADELVEIFRRIKSKMAWDEVAI